MVSRISLFASSQLHAQRTVRRETVIDCVVPLIPVPPELFQLGWLLLGR